MACNPKRVYLIFYGWIACNREGYICLTTHFVDTNQKLNCKLLYFCKMDTLHMRVKLIKKVYDTLKDLGIDKKVFSLTLDNASSNDNIQELSKQWLAS